MANRSLTTKDILQKEFKTSMRGYNPTEVDEYLDEVIRDYESYNKELTQLKAENDRLLSKIDELTKQASIANHKCFKFNISFLTILLYFFR